MGRTKKFIDKKKSATFQLISRDTSDPYYDDTPGNDRVFVRVDNNPVSLDISEDPDHQYDDDSRFDDAPGDDEGGDDFGGGAGSSSRAFNSGNGRLSDQVRREILELGFPDDGYNYLLHLREIKNSGGGSAFYQNPKFKAEEVPLDVKAYDASRVRVSEAKDDQVEKAIYSVASKTVNVRVQKAVDPEVSALLDDSDLSRFGSDVEDLEEDFVVVANLPEDGEVVDGDEELNLVEDSEVVNDGFEGASGNVTVDSGNRKVADEVRVQKEEEKPRARRPLDEQFDMLELQEYGSDDDDYGYDGYEAEGKILAEESKNVRNDLSMEDLELGDKYVGPADLLKASEGPISKELLDSAATILRRCAEYGEKYENGSEDDKAEIFEESSDESEQWDCESIISTYSNLENHPAKIGAPTARKKKLSEAVSVALKASGPVITLRGKEKLPIDFLPHSNKKTAAEKVKSDGGMKTEQVKKKPISQETKEEKKERKAALKEERREARKVKKEMKELYRGEAQRAQKAAAITGPSAIHLM